MEIIGIGILFVIGLYIMPFIFLGITMLFSVITYEIKEYFKNK